jgi:hypothetical protein
MLREREREGERVQKGTGTSEMSAVMQSESAVMQRGCCESSFRAL